MAYTQYSFVYRDGAPAGSPVACFYLCDNKADMTYAIQEGDICFEKSTGSFYTYYDYAWKSVESSNTKQRLDILEFLVAAIIEKGFGGL